jgi:hypothetical protein
MTDENRRLADKIALRLPNGMREQIAALAERNNRSTNSEIVARLQWTLDQDQFHVAPTGRPPVSQEDVILAIEQRVSELESAFMTFITNDRGYDHEMRITRLEKGKQDR